jgi:hypothetical protein
MRGRALLPPLSTSLVVGTTLCLVNGTFADGPPSRIALNDPHRCRSPKGGTLDDRP